MFACVKNKYILFAGIFLAAILLAVSLRLSAQPTVQLSEHNSGKTLVVKKGCIIILTLRDHVDGGYRFDSIRYNAKILQLLKHQQKPPAADSKPGAPGAGTWQFLALTAGETRLSLTATRPWHGGRLPRAARSSPLRQSTSHGRPDFDRVCATSTSGSRVPCRSWTIALRFAKWRRSTSRP